MKVVRHRRLTKAERAGTRVYEVDLCEVGPGRFVVNFRAGVAKGGAPARLQEGSRTPVPVDEAAAQAAFDRLIAERIAAGFVDAEAAPAEPPVLDAATSIEDVPDPRHVRLAAILAGDEPVWPGGELEAALWRAGELRVRLAAPAIAAVRPKTNQVAWHVARALLRCAEPGDPVAVEALRALADGRPAWVQAMVHHARAVVDPDGRDTLLAEIRAGLPVGLLVAVEGGAATAANRALVSDPD